MEQEQGICLLGTMEFLQRMDRHNTRQELEQELEVAKGNIKEQVQRQGVMLTWESIKLRGVNRVSIRPEQGEGLEQEEKLG